MAFSTNSNPNTRENIANVYGAKTLLALIPLNLTFEMDPSNRPGATRSARNRSAEEEPGSRTVKILGHISRPVVGEGRQTPDRQMFFVNSRPCNLPQVAKAFNEVYKSYNVTQSPFVFADIRLDTNAYDVNVSPDKRTIMLHDQTTLLENMKEALAELFAGHDQSVPQAQLLGKRVTSLLVPKSSLAQRRESSEATVRERSESSQVSEPCKASSVVPERSEPSPSSKERPYQGFIKASLIERFAGRDTKERSQHAPDRQRRSPSPSNDKATEETAQRAELRKSTSPEGPDIPVPNDPRSASPLFEPERDTSPNMPHSARLSRVVQDFNARIASQHAKQMESERSTISPDPREEDEEESIRAIKQTPKKGLSQSTVQNAFDRMRPLRTPAQQATITIGNTTTVSTVGRGYESRESKRARIYTPKFGLDGTPLNQTPKQPLFVKSLRGFAAPGTLLDRSDGEGGESSESDSDVSMSDVAPRLSSPQKCPPKREFEEPRTDDFDASPSAPVARKTSTVEERVTVDPSVEHPSASDKGSDDEYVDESEKKAREDARVAFMIAEAEEAASRPTEMNLKRADKLFKVPQKRYQTTHLEKIIQADMTDISFQLRHLNDLVEAMPDKGNADVSSNSELNEEDPEARLSLTVMKSDFNNMRIIGQFNLGFILAVRPPTPSSPSPDLFIIDQHASDEKYNFERLFASTILVSQRLVHSHPLELTAVEEEIILANQSSLTANGFVVEMDTSGNTEVGRRAKLTSLPMSKEVTFTPRDLEELLALVLDDPPSSSLSTSKHIPRPSKVRKLLASRACRSSVMIGKTLKVSQMENIVRHMGSMDKPWSCPHGRPTMRHLFELDRWERWREGDGVVGLNEVCRRADWAAYAKRGK